MSRSKKSSKLGYVITAFICAGGVFGVARYVQEAHADKVPAYEHRHEASQGLVTSARPSPRSRERASLPLGTKAYVYTPHWQDSNLTFSRKRLSVPDGEDPKVFAVNQFLANTKIADPSAKLLSVDVKNGVAALSFNAAMDATFGTEDEETLLNGLLATLSQFPDVEKAEFYANGKHIDTFGNVDLTEPQPVHGVGEASAKQTKEPTP